MLILCGTIALLLTDMGQTIYRPWVYENSVDDFGLAAAIGSIFGSMASMFFLTALIRKSKTTLYGIACGGLIGGVVYEFLQPHVGTGVFDPLDIIGVLLGATIAWLLVWTIWGWFPDEPEGPDA